MLYNIWIPRSRYNIKYIIGSLRERKKWSNVFENNQCTCIVINDNVLGFKSLMFNTLCFHSHKKLYVYNSFTDEEKSGHSTAIQFLIEEN